MNADLEQRHDDHPRDAVDDPRKRSCSKVPGCADECRDGQRQ
jgi:hypothetical protein